MSAGRLGLPATRLATLFPFHVGFDRDLRIVQVGPSWARAFPGVCEGGSMPGLFRIVRPAVPWGTGVLRDHEGSIVVLECLGVDLPLRGQFIEVDSGWLFLGSPWIRDPEQLARLDLGFADLPPHEAASDYLFLLQSKNAATEEARTLAERLTQQSAALRSALDALHEREAGLRAVLETVADGILTIDESGIVRSFNGAAARIFGYGPKDVIGRNVTVLMPSPDAEAHDDYLTRYLRTREARVIGVGRRVDGLRKDGTRVPLHLAVTEIELEGRHFFTGIVRDLSDWQAAQDELARQRSYFEQLFAHSPEAIALLDDGGRVLLVNAAFEELFGYPAGEIAGRGIDDAIMPPGQGEDAGRLLQKILAGQVVDQAGACRTADGRHVPVRVLGYPIGLAGGTQGAVVIYRDISPLTRAERQAATQYAVTRVLAESATLQEAAPGLLRALCELFGWDFGAVWTVDQQAGVLRCLDVWHAPAAPLSEFAEDSRVRSFGRGEGVPGRVWASGEPVWIPDVWDDRNFPRGPAARRGGLRGAFAVPIADGGPAAGVIEFLSREIRQPDLDTLTVLATVGNQTAQFVARRRADEALRASEEFVRQIVDTSLDAVISIDARGTVTLWSAQAEAIFGWSREEALGASLGSLIVPERLRAAHQAGMARYLATGHGPVLNRRIEVEAVRRDGREFPVELTISPLMRRSVEDGGPRSAASGQDVMFSAFVRDISDRRVAEAALRRAKDEAEAAARARTDFLAMMSHEIRTPLNGVVGMLDLLLGTGLDEEQREYASIGRRSAASLIDVANDILDFTKIGAARLVVESIPFDLGQVVDDVAAAFQAQARAGGIEVRARVEAGVPRGVNGDPGRLRQILMNLVGNAVKFTSHGHVELAVTAGPPGADGRRMCRFTVEDTGIGVPPTKQATIFEPFSQADTSTTRQFGGTGLGLPISARLAELMHGTVRLLRSTAAGSVFELELPLASATVTAARGVAGRRRKYAGRALLVDDNPVNQKIGVAMLGGLGCSIDVAATGLEALDMVGRSAYDLVFMDCQMPGLDGYETTRAIRRLGFDESRLPIVAMTASALPEDRARCLAAGMNEHLARPVRDEALIAVLDRWLQPIDEGQEGQAGPPTAPAAGPGAPFEPARLQRARELMGATPGGWASVVGAFIAHGEETEARLRAALEAGQCEDVRREAHGLKGSAAMLGAVRLSELCAALERTVAGGRSNAAVDLADAIRDELARAVMALEGER